MARRGAARARGLAGRIRPHRAAVRFAGVYTVEDLELRDAMLDLLEASVALMNEDLRVLLIERSSAGGAASAAGRWRSGGRVP